ncbi:MAG: hydantoinase/oxoprolinase family protein [Rhodospirillaceae bacterium]|jgi:N-methylhydantoinase A|nr:hydantoinase/oxoprolinase family protein [Rhodospirillaceae bacterium]
MYRIGIDIGGTFTDLVVVDDAGAVHFGKTPSTPEDQSIGVMAGLAMMAARLSTPLTDMLGQTERIVHGMTVATNALLERKGARLGLLTTEGHRDVLEMREGLKPERYNLRLPRHPALAPRELRLGVRERMRHTGAVETPLDRVSLDAAIETLRQVKVEAIAVCYLHAYANPAHERETRDRLTEKLPDVYVSLSSDVLPQIKEYERVSTTAVNAYVGPALERYLGRLQDRLRDAGYDGPALITLSHGGVAPIVEAIRLAAGTVLSGPAGGLAGARHASGVLDVGDLIPFDMGGTSTDISLIVDGEVTLSSDRTVAGERIALSSLDIVTLGAGGGSIAWVDTGGLLNVGPQSAGAVPGPASYGKGGVEPTVTDANVALGFLDPAGFSGGRDALDVAAADAALDKLAAKLGIDRIAAAEGVFRVVNTQMAEGVRLATVRRGVDPRRFALFGFGGAAGLHVTSLARMLDIKRAVIPRMASVLSAWGMLTTDLRYEMSRTKIGEIGQMSPSDLQALFGGLEDDARGALESWFDGDIRTSRTADMRYGEQIFEIDVDLNHVDLADSGAAKAAKKAFEARHEDLYTYSLPDREPVLVNARVAAIGELSAPPAETLVPGGPDAKPTGTREIYLDGWTDAPVFAFADLPAGQVISGPALIEADTTTVLLRPDDVASVTETGWLDISVNA